MSRVLIGIAGLLLITQAISAEEKLCPEGANDCDWLAWGKWTSCSKECGEGTRHRSRGLCCDSTKDFEVCRKHCGLEDKSFESAICGNVCPTGNCTFDKFIDTGLEATNYQDLTDGNLIQNPPLLLRIKNAELCAARCLGFNLQNGMRCWAYQMMPQGCEISFYPSPLSIQNQSYIGLNPDSDIYLRKCPEVVPCRATLADIVLVVDSSGSIGSTNFDKIKAFLQDLVNSFDIDTDLTRVGLLVFNDYMKWEFNLGDINDKVDMLKTIKNIQYVIGGTQTHDALDEVRLNGFANNSRPGIPQIAIVITDGMSRYPGITKLRAAMLRDAGVQVYALGIGNGTNVDELYNMASAPEDQFVMEFEDFETLGLGNLSFGVSYVPCKEETLNLNGTTTAAPAVESNCTDKELNCALYGRDMCTDYAPWAHEHCALYCEFCQGPPQVIGPCEDKIPNCASYGTYICEEKDYVEWTRQNCQRHCGICGSSTTPTTTTPMPTTTVKICQDDVDNCYGYKESCSDPKFQAYLKSHCPETCGFCTSYQSIIGQHLPNMAATEKCPDWWLPTECTMEKSTDQCCPLPKCPGGYYTTAELDLTGF